MDTQLEKKEIVVFGGGCFWCTEAVFKMVEGVQSVTPGYAGGNVSEPTYEIVSAGNSGHVEVVQIEFNPKKVDFEDLLTIFFGSHDPTTLNRQGADVGEQYASVVFYTTKEQKNKTEMFISQINTSNKEGDLVVTKVEPLDTFYEAEEYHKDYFTNNKMNPYCMVVINPKLKKVQKKYAHLLAKQNHYEK